MSSNFFQISPILAFDNPVRCATFARLQCVAFGGVDSKVATTTSTTWSIVIVAGRPRIVRQWFIGDIAAHVRLAVEHLGDGRLEVAGLVPLETDGHPQQLIDRDVSPLIARPVGATDA